MVIQHDLHVIFTLYCCFVDENLDEKTILAEQYRTPMKGLEEKQKTLLSSKDRSDLSSGKKSHKSRVSMRLSTGSKARQSHAPNAAEKVESTLKHLESLIDTYSRKFEEIFGQLDEEDDGEGDLESTKKILDSVRKMGSALIPLLSSQAAFDKLDQSLTIKIINQLSRIVRSGSSCLIYEDSLKETLNSCKAVSALEAAIIIERLLLRISGKMAVPEDSVALSIEVTRFHLQQNVLPFYDRRIQAAVRPNLREDAKDDTNFHLSGKP